MAGFRNIRAITDAELAGKSSFCSFRKVPSQASTAGRWVDLSMAAGNPVPNYYVGDVLTATLLEGGKGIYHGDDKSPSSKHIAQLGLTTPTAALVGQYSLLDYLIFYSFIDMDDTDTQLMDNTVTLPRYTDGSGVMAMAVCVAPTTGSGSFTFDYINECGIAKTSPTQFCDTTASSISNIVTSAPGTVAGNGKFLTLADGCNGIQRITSVTMLVPNGGLMAIVLVQPLGDSVIREINTTTELEFVTGRPGLPRIQDGAYLHLIMNCAGSVAAGQLSGYAKFIWS